MIKFNFAKKYSIAFIVGVVAISAIIFYRSQQASTNTTAAAPINVKVEKIGASDVPVYVEAIGSLAAKARVDISPQIAGQIKAVKFRYGTPVQAGQVLYQLDDLLYKAERQATESDLTLSKMSYQRLLKLATSGSISKQALDQAKSAYQVAQSKFNVVSVELAKTKIKAPFSGVIGASQVDVGQYVAVGESLTTLVDAKNLIVKFSVPQNNVKQLAKNQRVTIQVDNLPDEIFQGRVSYISPVINSDTRTVKVWATVPNADNQLTAGLFVHVKLTIGEQKNVLLVPQQALVPTVEGNNVFVVKHDKAYQVAVKIGQRVGDKIVIEKGIKLGDVLVTEGQEKLSNGRAVSVV